MNEKKTVAVLFGGKSTEYSVSLQSAYSVLKELNREKYNVLPIGITEEGTWYLYTGNLEDIPNNTWYSHDITPVLINPGPLKQALIINQMEVHIDAAFPILHGINGEDGTVQGLFALAGIPVIGCGILASALCMDKKRAHDLVSAAGIRCAESVILTTENWWQKQTDNMKLPVYVKPVHAGSSIGIHRCTCEDEIPAALKDAFSVDCEVMIEEEVQGIEIGAAIIGNDDEMFYGRADEIELSHGFFDFEEKYTLKTSAIHMPARIPEAEEKRILDTAGRIYKILGCSGFARVDMFYTPEKEIFFNEVNTIPGFTSHSRFPNMMKGAGLSFADTLEKIISLYL